MKWRVSIIGTVLVVLALAALTIYVRTYPRHAPWNLNVQRMLGLDDPASYDKSELTSDDSLPVRSEVVYDPKDIEIWYFRNREHLVSNGQNAFERELYYLLKIDGPTEDDKKLSSQQEAATHRALEDRKKQLDKTKAALLDALKTSPDGIKAPPDIPLLAKPKRAP